LPSGKFAAFATPTRDELSELKLTASRLRQHGAVSEAERLEKLALKVESVIQRPTLHCFEQGIEVLMEATGIIVRLGPKAAADPDVVETLREAILTGNQVRLSFRRRDNGEPSRPRLHPYGPTVRIGLKRCKGGPELICRFRIDSIPDLAEIDHD
jgi:hypothetical protein